MALHQWVIFGRYPDGDERADDGDPDVIYADSAPEVIELFQKHYLHNEFFAGIKWFGRHGDLDASNSTEQGAQFDLLNKIFDALENDGKMPTWGEPFMVPSE